MKNRKSLIQSAEQNIDSFVQSKNSLVDKLDELDTENANKRKEILKSFNIDQKVFKRYVRFVYNNCSDQDLGSCQDVLGPDNGIYTLFGTFSNLSASFENMEKMTSEMGMYKFDDMSGRLLEQNNEKKRFKNLQKYLNNLHSDEKFSPNIDDFDEFSTIIKNIQELEKMLERLNSL